MLLRRWRVLAWVACVGCVATPLPDPPSADPATMTLTEAQMRLELRGGPAAIRPGGARLRVTNPGRARAEVEVDASGGFVVALPGSLADTIYLERIGIDRDAFLIALTSDGADAVRATDSPDRDRDGSPDAIDCAPDDPAVLARECGTLGTRCVGDAECGGDLVCTGGACCELFDTCGNANDDDCDAIVDDDC